MALLDWQDRFALGVAEMDREHQELLAAMNRIHELATSAGSKSEIDAAISRLAELTTRHFADEEKHMEATGYDGIERHKMIHADMLRRVGEYHAAFQAGDGTVDERFFGFLVNWLTAHICHIDRKYAEAPQPN